MSLFALSSYSFDPAALPFLLAGVLAFGIGTGLMLYERFTPASRRFFALALVMSAWLLAYGASYLAAADALAQLWYRVGLGLTVLGVPLVYGLALNLTGRSRPRLLMATWAGAVVMALTAAGPLPSGISQLIRGPVLEGWGPLAATYVAYIAVVLALVILEFWRAYRAAPSRIERVRHLTMLAAMTVAGLGLVDFFVPSEMTLPSGIAPLVIAISLFLMGLAGTRYRTFSVSARFATDEVLRAMGDAVLVCDASGVIRVANAEARRLLGAREEALIESHVERWLVAQDGAAGPLRAGDPLASVELARDREMVVRSRAGESIEVSVSIEPIEGGGERRGLVIVARDIRDRAKAERALQSAERRYMSLFWHNPGPAYEFDLEGRFLAVNPAVESLLERSDEELRGRPFGEVIAPRDLDRATAIFEAVLRGDAREYEIAIVRPSGEERELRGVSIPILEEGEVVGVFGVALDTTEQMQAKRELEVQRRYFADLFEGSPEGIAMVEADTDRVLRVNAEFTRLFGYTSEEAVGRNLNDLIVPDDLTWEGSQLNQAAREGGRVWTETVRRRKDGSTVEVSVLARGLTIPGESEQLYGVYRDIRDRKETERALREREEELRHAQKLEAVGKLAGGIAHDFNNLLTVINGHAGFLLQNVEPGSPLERDLLEIEKAGSRAASLTQQLLAYSRRQVLHPRLLDPNAVVAEIQDTLGRLIGEHIRVETHLTQEDVRVRADRGQLEQVLINLVVNARDAMPDGGTLGLETHVLTLEPGDRRIARWDVKPGRFVCIRVADTGTGMDPETLRRAFEPFFTTKGQGQGTGLGLATVFGIVKQSGGHVVATSTPGEGTACDVILPVADADTPAEPAARSDGRPAQPGGTVLVVEDETAVRKLVVRILERAGCTVLAAENGTRALEVIGAHEGDLDLVVTDMVMPDMGGRELADHLRRGYPDLPILFMSGYDDELGASADDDAAFLAKPFTPETLVRQVAAAMGAEA